MQLYLYRQYLPGGTNGFLFIDEAFVCATIELPWLNNQPQHSCIPEGRYGLEKRWSEKFGTHLLVRDVPGRSAILVHPANNAVKELKGCIAPVLKLTGPGKGNLSRMALASLMRVLSEAPEEEKHYLNISHYTLKFKQTNHEPDTTNTIAHA